MPTPIKRAELAAMVPHLRGEMRQWCELSSVGSPGTTVYADAEMLARCKAASEASQTKKAKSKSKAKDEDVQGQSGAVVESSVDAVSVEEASPDSGS